MYLLIVSRMNGEKINFGPFISHDRAERYARATIVSVVGYARHHIEVLVVPHCSNVAMVHVEERAGY